MTGSVANPYIRDAPIPPSVRYRSLARYDVNKSESFSDHGRRERKKEAVEAIAVPLSQSDLLFGIPTVPSSGKPASAFGKKTIGST